MEYLFKIRNPRELLLPPDCRAILETYGKIKPLSFGKMKGFRIQYHDDLREKNKSLPNDKKREKIINLLMEYRIYVTACSETLLSSGGHLNIHEIAVLKGSAGYEAFCSQITSKL